MKGPGFLEAFEPPPLLDEQFFERFDERTDFKEMDNGIAEKTFHLIYIGRKNQTTSTKTVASSCADEPR